MNNVKLTDRQIATRWVAWMIVVMWGMFFAPPLVAQTITSGTAQGVNITPATWTFANTAEGSSSASKSFTVTNGGTTTLTFTGISVGGAYTQSFPLTKTCGATLASKKTCTVTVTFSPKASPVAMTGSLDVLTNKGNVSASLKGTSTAPTPVQVLSATSLAFGSIGTGVTSAPKTITVTNTGKGALVFPASGSVTLSASVGFVVASNTCAGASLPQSGSCAINVTFAPTTSGVKSATLKVVSNGTPTGASVALSGTGVTPAPGLTLSPTKVVFTCPTPYGGPMTAGVLASSTGTGPVNITGITISAGAPYFTTATNCVGTLQPGTTCGIAVTFRPTGKNNKVARLGTLSVASNAGTKTASLSGTCASHPSP